MCLLKVITSLILLSSLLRESQAFRPFAAKQSQSPRLPGVVSEYMGGGGRDLSMNLSTVWAAQDAGKVQNYPLQALNFGAAFFTHPMLKTSFLCYCYFKFQWNGSTFASCPFFFPLLIMDKSSFYPSLCVSASVWQGLWRTEGTGQEVFAKACGFLLHFFLFQLALVRGLWGVLEER